MPSNLKLRVLLGVLLLFPLFSAKFISENSPTQSGTALNPSSSTWGVKPGDILSYTVQVWLDDQDFLQQALDRKPLVVKVLIERTPYVPRYFQDQISQSSSFFPQLQILGYFHDNPRSSSLDLSAEFPEFSMITTHSSVLESQAAVYPGFLDYYAKLYRSGTVFRTEDTENGEIYELKLEHGAHYFRATDKAEILSPALSVTSMVEFSRQDGILRELQIEVSRFFSPDMVQDRLQDIISPGSHKIEEHIEFLKKESGGYIHAGNSDIEPLILLATLGSAFGLGTIAGIRMRRYIAQKNF